MSQPPSSSINKYLLLFTLIAVFAAGILLTRWYFKRQEAVVQENGVVLLERIKQVAKLITVEGYFSEIYDYQDYYGYDLSIFRKKALIRVKAKVSVGYDLEKMKVTSDAATKTIHLSGIPPAEILSIEHDLDYYDVPTLEGILHRSAAILGIPITPDGAYEIARRSRGTPRVANALLRRIRDFAQIKGNGEVTQEIARYGLTALDVDESGLDEMDIRILTTIIHKFKGGPVGLTTIGTAVGEDAGTIEEVHEPFLIMEGYLQRTPRGRIATEKAYKHIGAVPPKVVGTLF